MEMAEGGRKGPTREEIRRLYAEGSLILSALRNMYTLPATQRLDVLQAVWLFAPAEVPFDQPCNYPDTGEWGGS